ncbi:MAG: formate--tetrahydrofolate ligase [Kiritimatiellia bacterium]
MKLDPLKMKDWQIADAAAENMVPFNKLARDLGFEDDELIPMGRRIGKVDFLKAMERLPGKKKAKYIDVTAITPTPAGEGKTTTSIGLIQGLGKLGKKAVGAIRQPSGGPTFNIKGSAAGGGLAQCIPLTEFSLGLTGDIDAITNAHNLAMVALTSRIQHENNYNDAELAKRNLKRLNIDPTRVETQWVMDFCAQALRKIRIGIGGRMDGYEMDSGFAITVSSEIMAILAVARDLRDLRERLGRIVLASDREGNDITTADLEVDGAMAAWLVNAVNPNLLQTIEGQPVFVHAGPFANIAIGQSSIIADELGTRLAEYHVTESGFGADIGYEKFWNLKCRISGLKPDAVVLVATIRALKMHGGGPRVVPGLPLDKAYTEENLDLLQEGCCNLTAHINTIRESGVRPVVCLNRFYTDSDAEIALVRKTAGEHGALCAVSDHWMKGGEGAIELAEAVMHACEEKNNFHFLYESDTPHAERIEKITKKVYRGTGVAYTEKAKAKLEAYSAHHQTAALATCMLKTHLSLSHDKTLKGCPTGWELPVSDILLYKGAGFLVPVAGTIRLMPGTGSNPAFKRIDIDVTTGKVKGLF